MGISQPGLTQRVGIGWQCLEGSLSDCNLKYQSIPMVCTAQWQQMAACFMCPCLSKHHLITAMGKSIYKGFSSKPCLITPEAILMPQVYDRKPSFIPTTWIPCRTWHTNWSRMEDCLWTWVCATGAASMPVGKSACDAARAPSSFLPEFSNFSWAAIVLNNRWQCNGFCQK